MDHPGDYLGHQLRGGLAVLAGDAVKYQVVLLADLELVELLVDVVNPREQGVDLLLGAGVDDL